MLIRFAVTTKLICVFVFAYEICWFSHDMAQIISYVWHVLAHLSQRLMGKLIGFSRSSARPSFVVVNNFKNLHLQNSLPDQSQILCGSSLVKCNESLFAASGSHDQDSRRTHIWEKTLQKSNSNRILSETTVPI